MNETAPLPLDGVTVVAIEQAVAAPFCTARLADAGARVIKIERPEGDFARGYDNVAAGESSYFVWLNRGKESVTLDLSSPGDFAVLSALIAKADVLVQNLKHGAMERLGLGRDMLRRRHPKLIMCSISGYGDEGPLADRKAYDLLVQAESGLASITGSPAEPARVGVSVVDIATGASAYSAILEALLARARTGLGSDIRLSLFDVMADWMTVPLLHQQAGRSPQRVGLAHPSVAPYGVFKTRDNQDVLISIQNDREWRQFCVEILGEPSAADDAHFATNIARVRGRAATDALVRRAFGERDAAELIAALSSADIAFACVNDLEALSKHPHLRRINVETGGGPVSYPAPPAIFVGAPRSYGRVPHLGEHTKLVKGELEAARGLSSVQYKGEE
jgi:crotonobetainyl-CoA:carnitine CoA-transferase CaiB-like acyl-CoA transferase